MAGHLRRTLTLHNPSGEIDYHDRANHKWEYVELCISDNLRTAFIQPTTFWTFIVLLPPWHARMIYRMQRLN